jgi:acetyltransferase-like isoleucine patch superfamily enzyme
LHDGVRVSGNAIIYSPDNHLVINGNARIRHAAYIRSEKDFLVIGPAFSSGRYTTAYKTRKDIAVATGCFCGSMVEFEKQIKQRHRNGSAARSQYMAFHELITKVFAKKVKP